MPPVPVALAAGPEPLSALLQCRSIPSGDLGPLPSCDGEGGARKRDLVGRRPSCQTGLPPEFSRSACGVQGASGRGVQQLRDGPTGREWGRGFRNLPSLHLPAEAPGTVLGWSLPVCRAWEGSGQLWGPGSPPVPLPNASERDAQEEIKWGVSGCWGFLTSQGAGQSTCSKPSCRVDTRRELAKERPAPAAFPCVLAV